MLEEQRLEELFSLWAVSITFVVSGYRSFATSLADNNNPVQRDLWVDKSNTGGIRIAYNRGEVSDDYATGDKSDDY